MSNPQTLDSRIAGLVSEVDVALRGELQGALRALRDAHNPLAVLLSLSRLSLRLLNFLFQCAGQTRPSDNLFDCIVVAGRGDAEKKIKGLRLMPDEMATCLHAIRTYSNKADHAAEKIQLGIADAEIALNLFLRVLEWVYREYEHGPRLPTIDATIPAPMTDSATPCPYRGLLAFREEDHAFFFGRAELAEELRRKVRPHTLTAVVGPSGTGKSSVVQAGLLPLLRKQRAPEITWEVISFSPGNRPFFRLAAALLPLLEPTMSETDRQLEAEKLGTAWRTGLLRLETTIDRVVRKATGADHLLLIAARQTRFK